MCERPHASEEILEPQAQGHKCGYHMRHVCMITFAASLPELSIICQNIEELNSDETEEGTAIIPKMPPRIPVPTLCSVSTCEYTL